MRIWLTRFGMLGIRGEIDDRVAWLGWYLITFIGQQSNFFLLHLGNTNDKGKPSQS
jgi:hypothetical protein